MFHQLIVLDPCYDLFKTIPYVSLVETQPQPQNPLYFQILWWQHHVMGMLVTSRDWEVYQGQNKYESMKA
jgi:hypothetical protein